MARKRDEGWVEEVPSPAKSSGFIDEEGHRTRHRPYVKGAYGNAIQDTPRTFAEETGSPVGSDFWEMRPEDRMQYTKRVKRAPGYVKYGKDGQERIRPYKGTSIFSRVKKFQHKRGKRFGVATRQGVGLSRRSVRGAGESYKKSRAKEKKERQAQYERAMRIRRDNRILKQHEIGRESQARRIRDEM